MNRVRRWFAESWRSGRWLYRRTAIGLILTLTGANIVGACVVFMLSVLIVPGDDDAFSAQGIALNVIFAAAYVAVASPLGTLIGVRRFKVARQWLRDGGPPSPQVLNEVLRGPQRITVVMGVLWALGVVGFGALNVLESFEAGLKTALVIAFGGLTTCSIAFLLAERVLREAAATALSEAAEVPSGGLGVAGRWVLTWVLATGVPVLGLTGLGIAALAGADGDRFDLALATTVLGAIVLVVGLLATVVAARATADPVASVRRALAQVEAGDLDVEIPVYDATEVGSLQSGFNRMVARLKEREELRDLFGRHVGEDVARAALEQGVELGGELTRVAALFVDLTGSTSYAENRPPGEVVELLNRFFAAVVEVVDAHDGSVNKFQGDAALAIFGAPRRLSAPATKALAAARELAARIRESVPELEAGLGVSGGDVFAGNVGARHRYEFTVIGDPVNEAARLSDHAKQLPGRVAASATLLEHAAPDERDHWRIEGEVTLRGRDRPTTLAVPKD